MTPKAMRTLGTIMLIVGICMAVPGIIGLVTSDDFDIKEIFVLFYLFGTLIGLGSIPLLIVSGIKIRNAENKTAREEIYGYCPKCGNPRRREDTFCSNCGTQLPY
ncbi:MAG: zinc-ribbon domain-containing protein [Ruminococcaceae bacterium]|nr:zinc-ribbon domain-containing protein [Oscillospiraceae bacterium]